MNLPDRQQLKSWMGVAALVFIAGLLIVGFVIVRDVIEDLPDVNSLEEYVPPLVTQITDTYGQPVGEFFTERRTTVPLTQIPVDLRAAVMAIEDTSFYHHWGVNPRAILRASFANLLAGRVVQGGSTLTQQLAKTIFLTRKKTLGRKFKELFLTLEIEHRYSKDEILQLYLNQIYFGGGAHGVEAAARLYFNKHAQELTLAECALLGGLIRSPNRYSPANNVDIARDRRATVLRRMKDLKFISEAEEKQAAETPIAATAGSYRLKEAPYLVEEIRKSLEPVYGTETLEQGGLQIRTTIDVKMQKAAEAAVEQHALQYDLKFATATLAEYNKDLAKSTSTIMLVSTIAPNIQVALVAIDVHTGAIRAMVGGRDFVKSQFNRAMQAKRQPGSSFKPFVYATALEGSFTAASVVEDNPIVFIDVESDPTLLAETTTYAEMQLAILDNLQMTQEELDAMKKEDRDLLMKRYWRPQNFDGKYLGPLTLRKALQKSRNLVSIRLVDSVGPRNVTRFGHAAGINSYLAPVLSLGLGTSVVNLVELTCAYGTLASGGFYAEPYFIERVADHRGKILRESTPKIVSRLNPQTVYLIINIMKGVVERGTATYARRLGRPIAGKTGTTQDQRDLLFVGFTPDLVCGVWVGYDDFRPLKKGLSASNIAVPLWTDFMKEALKSYPVKDFPIPPKIEFAKIDADTGYLALPSCPKVILEAFREGTIPTEFCPYDHTQDQSNEGDEALE